MIKNMKKLLKFSVLGVGAISIVTLASCSVNLFDEFGDLNDHNDPNKPDDRDFDFKIWDNVSDYNGKEHVGVQFIKSNDVTIKSIQYHTDNDVANGDPFYGVGFKNEDELHEKFLRHFLIESHLIRENQDLDKEQLIAIAKYNERNLNANYNKGIIKSTEDLEKFYPKKLLPEFYYEKLLDRYDEEFFKNNSLIFYRGQVADSYPTFNGQVIKYRPKIEVNDNWLGITITQTTFPEYGEVGPAAYLFLNNNFIFELNNKDFNRDKISFYIETD